MKKLWFKAKQYGWGWYPATWQGWVVTGTYVLIVLIIPKFLQPSFLYFLILGIATAILIFICYKTGEKPEWRWGKKK